MEKTDSTMIDMVFELDGESLPASYPFVLWNELVRCVPHLADDESVGIIPLRTAESGENMLLPKRTKLVIRLPQALKESASELPGSKLDISGNPLHLGAAHLRQIQPSPTLHAQLVTGDDNEASFLKKIQADLDAMGIKAKMICGRRRTLSDNSHTLSGYSLVIHDLAPEASLRLQSAGLGGERRFGCGIFMPHKVISGLE